MARVARVSLAQVQEWEATGQITVRELGAIVTACRVRPGRIFGGFFPA
jgi:hypothetical protein